MQWIDLGVVLVMCMWAMCTLVVPQTYNRFGSLQLTPDWNDFPPRLWQPELSFPAFRQQLGQPVRPEHIVTCFCFVVM